MQQYCSQSFLFFLGNDFSNPLTYQQPLSQQKSELITLNNPQLLTNKYYLLNNECYVPGIMLRNSHVFPASILIMRIAQRETLAPFHRCQKGGSEGLYSVTVPHILTRILVIYLNRFPIWLHLRQIAFHCYILGCEPTVQKKVSPHLRG